MSEYRRNEDGSIVKVALVEQETQIDIAGLESRESELSGQVEEARANLARLEAEHGEVKSDLEGAKAVVPASEEVADEQTDESVESTDEGTPEEAPVF